ncbi:hypothetical protein [Rhodococcoides yunnanense]|uniref:hypothetical protein n=1 Tax=Rhodococcoides yunnanense TaxID=278209 RepID=UPI000932F6F6|nr:hypothetical protein [Rhodococcus yunnanensis]
MTTLETTSTPTAETALRTLYFVRSAFAIVWAAALLLTASTAGPLLTVVLVVYPLFDAAAVFWQLRSRGDARVPELVNIVVSVAVAVALGWASTVSMSAALVVWGLWAIGAGIPQLITAVRRRSAGGQVAQMFSGGISVVAGAAFLAQGLGGADSITGVGGYAVLGAVFFLISAFRLRTR